MCSEGTGLEVLVRPADLFGGAEEQAGITVSLLQSEEDSRDK